MSKVVRVAVTGAAGRVSSSLIVRLASGEVFGPETKVILQLLELPAVAMKNLEGAMYELQDCGFSTLQDVIITDDPNKAFAGCNCALLVGAAPRGPGEQRADLIRKNGPIFVGQGQAIAKNAACGRAHSRRRQPVQHELPHRLSQRQGRARRAAGTR